MTFKCPVVLMSKLKNPSYLRSIHDKHIYHVYWYQRLVGSKIIGQTQYQSAGAHQSNNTRGQARDELIKCFGATHLLVDDNYSSPSPLYNLISASKTGKSINWFPLTKYCIP